MPAIAKPREPITRAEIDKRKLALEKAKQERTKKIGPVHGVEYLRRVDEAYKNRKLFLEKYQNNLTFRTDFIKLLKDKFKIKPKDIIKIKQSDNVPAINIYVKYGSISGYFGFSETLKFDFGNIYIQVIDERELLIEPHEDEHTISLMKRYDNPIEGTMNYIKEVLLDELKSDLSELKKLNLKTSERIISRLKDTFHQNIEFIITDLNKFTKIGTSKLYYFKNQMRTAHSKMIELIVNNKILTLE